MLAQILKRTPVKKLCYLDFRMACAYEQWLQRVTAAKSGQLLLVYQMGKVGSTTLVKSLQVANPALPIYHVHALTPEAIARHRSIYRRNFLTTGTIPRHHIESTYLRSLLDQFNENAKRWKVITLVRDPVARNVSSFFQTLQLYFGYDRRRQAASSPAALAQVKALFQQSCESSSHLFRHETPLHWMDAELKAVFGVDIYACDFPKDLGYKLYLTEQVDVLVIRLENLNSTGKDGCRAFLELPNFELSSANVGSEKGYQALYRDFKGSVVIPDWYLQKMYDSPFTRHFYSAEEITAFRQNWARK